MADFHRNVFSYYRGAMHLEQEWEQQREDNTTKALVNTLEYCTPDVSIRFLHWLGIRRPGRAEFRLQRPTIGHERIARRPQRLLLAIVGEAGGVNDTVCAHLPGQPIGDSRPDAWIWGDDFVVLVESKTGGSSLDLNQMACHWAKLQPTSLRIVTWADVYKFFVTLKPEVQEPKSRWLVDQFTQYLEWTGMTEFVGFDEGMFEFFIETEKDPDTKKWLRGTMEGLAEKILTGRQGLREFDAFYQDKHVGNFGKDADHFWVAFGPEDFKNHAHQTVSLYEEGLDVFVNVELKPAVKKLRKKIKAGAGFRRAICRLPPPFTVRIEERRATGLPHKFDYYILAEVEGGVYKHAPYGLKDAASAGFKYVESLLRDVPYPYFSLRRRIERNRVLELSERGGGALVGEILATLKSFHPLVKFINE